MYTSYIPGRHSGKPCISLKWLEPFPKIPSSARVLVGLLLTGTMRAALLLEEDFPYSCKCLLQKGNFFFFFNILKTIYLGYNLVESCTH